MKITLLVLLLVPFTANAQSLNCPKKSGDDHLIGASVFFDETSQIQGERRELKNGYDEKLPLNVQYLVCEYSNGKKKWNRFRPKEDITHCTLQLRETKTSVEKIALICR